MEPSLPLGVPGNIERLIAAVVKFDEVLLQGIHAERIGDGEFLVRTFCCFRSDDVATINFPKQGFNATMRKCRFVEVT